MRRLRDNSRIKIACKHCNCGDAKFFLIEYRKKQRINARVALIFKSIIILLIIFLGFIKSKPC